MTPTPTENLVARFVLGELTPEEAARVRQDPSCAQLTAEMETTLSALRHWRDWHAALPITRARRARALPLTVAAAVAAVIVLWLSWPQPSELEAELTWLPLEAPGERTSLHIDLNPLPPRSGGGAGGGGPLETVPSPALDAFMRQFAFAFRAPASLPDGYTLERGQAVSAVRCVLFYASPSRSLTVYMARSPGPEHPPQRVRQLVAARRRGVLVAFDASVPTGTWNLLIDSFIVKEDVK